MVVTGVVLEEQGAYDAEKKQTPDYDGLWKKIIEDLFQEFVLFFAPDLYEEIDFEKQPDFLKQELNRVFNEANKGKLIADQIVKVFLKSGQEKWILIHIEVQGEPETDFGKRMFKYFYRIFDYFDREVYAIALLTNRQKTKHTDGFHYSFFGTKVDYEYNVYTFDPKNISELEQSSNPFAAAVIAVIYANKAKEDAEKRYKFKRKLMIQVLQKHTLHQENARMYLSALFYFIDYLLQIPEAFTKQLTKDIIPYLGKEVRQQMEAERTNPSQTLEEIFTELRKEGREEGIEKGKEEALKPVIQELVREKFSNEQIARITKLSMEEVAAWRKSLK